MILAAATAAAAAVGIGVFSAAKLPGDINGDGGTDNKDVVILFRFITENGGPGGDPAYDFNSDGSANNKDVVALFRSVSASEDPSDPEGEISTEPGGTEPCSGFEFVFASSYGIKPGEVDAEAFSAMLSDENIQNRTIYFADGVYVFTSSVELVSDVSLCGGANTVFTLSESSVSDTLFILKNVGDVKLSDLKISGGLTSRPSEKGGRTGIRIDSCRSVNIEDCDICGWSLYGLYGKTMSSYGDAADGKFYKQLQLVNTRFYNNYCGTYYDYRCEYTQTLNCVFGENHIGSVNCGGNNMYVSCMWNANAYGFVMNNSGSNPAHGSYSASTFNHNSVAIQINDCVNGWVFDGCQVFYGRIELKNSRGVVFTGNVWGSCVLSSRNSQKNCNIVSDTYFLTDSEKILGDNDGSVYISNCIPDHTDAEQTEEQQEVSGSVILSTAPASASPQALSTNAYSAASSYPVPAGTEIDHIDFLTVNTSESSEIKKVNVWTVDADTGEVKEHLVSDEDMSVVYSDGTGGFSVRVNIKKAYGYPVYFCVQCERVNGKSIAYYRSGTACSGWLRGDTAPDIGEILEGNSDVIPIYAAVSG